MNPPDPISDPVSISGGEQERDDLPFRIVVDDRVPPHTAYALDPKAIPDIFEWLRLEGDEELIVAVHTEADATRIINSPKLIAALSFKPEGF